MTRIKFMISVCIGTFIYILLSIIAGRNGFYAYNQLYEQKLRLTANVSSLMKVNEQLQSEYDALKTDRSIIESYARSLGFSYDGERIIKITGIGVAEHNVYDTGTVVKIQEITFVPEYICKIAGLIAFCVSMIFMLLFSFRAERKKAPHAVLVNGNDEITLPVEVVDEIPQV
ncbi:MAG: septum formation initiator family protein [Treponemataceae bacterium]|nr:septum formation initiator family protein [Treponemataceae bacterium]